MKTEAISGRREYLINRSPGFVSASTVSMYQASDIDLMVLSSQSDEDKRLAEGLTLCQEIQFINEESLILRPSKVKCLWRQ